MAEPPSWSPGAQGLCISPSCVLDCLIHMCVSSIDAMECSNNEFLESIKKEGTQISIKHSQDYPSPATQWDKHIFTPTLPVFHSLSSIPLEVSKQGQPLAQSSSQCLSFPQSFFNRNPSSALAPFPLSNKGNLPQEFYLWFTDYFFMVNARLQYTLFLSGMCF